MGDENVGSTSSSCAAESPAGVVGGGMSLQRCHNIIQKTFQHPKVKILIENMEKSGCTVGKNFIRAINCKGDVHAGHFGRGNEIGICCNHMNYKDYVVQAVIHELIHAYDDCRAANMDWGNSAHQACSEIRANHLSGDCHYMRELLRGHLQHVKGHEPKCVKRRAMQSMGANHSQAASKFAVEAVWDTCYNDTAPFDRAP